MSESEPTPSPTNFKIQASMEQRDAAIRDTGDKLEVSQRDIEILTTLASLALTHLVALDRGTPTKVREGALAVFRAHTGAMRDTIDENGLSVLCNLLTDGVALLTEGRLGQYAMFPHKGASGEQTS